MSEIRVVLVDDEPLLRHGLRTRNLREIAGQLPRIVFGFLGSLIGRVPTGNTGGANVPAEQPMPIPAELQAILNSAHENYGSA